MGLIRPATPGFLVTLAATALLAVVSFSVPYFKSVYFLKAGVTQNGISGNIIFGTLGYCFELPTNTTCSKPSIGYSLDINGLVGDNIKLLQIPTVVVKWITYALVLHVVALVLAAISAVFGLLAHVREMSMACCSSCITGFAATVALFAFIFDLVLFFVAKSRINKVQGGSATIGLGIWLTLAAWVLLFFSGCFYGLGRCCIKRRPKGDKDGWAPPKAHNPAPAAPYSAPYANNAPYTNSNPYSNAGGPEEQMRLDAIRREADRKAAQKQAEGGLPRFHEYENDPAHAHETQPLKARIDGDEVVLDDGTEAYRDHQPAHTPSAGPQYPHGYAAGYAGAGPPRRQPSANATTYPPQPQQPGRQGSAHSSAPSARTTPGLSQSPPPMPQIQHPGYGGAAAVAAPMAAGAAAYGTNQYLNAGQGYGGHQQYASGQGYGHGRDNTTFHSAASHQQEPTYHDPYAPAHSSFNADSYNNTAALTMPPAPYTYPHQESQYYTPNSEPQSYYGAHPNTITPGGQAQEQEQQQQYTQPERSYTLGGNGYGGNSVPPLADTGAYGGYTAPSPPMPSAGANHQHTPTSPVGGSRVSSPPMPQHMSESPPGYEGPLGGAPPVPAWDSKR